jgi:hypothetical protein
MLGSLLMFAWGCATPNPDGIVQNGVESQMREKESYSQACYDSEYKKLANKPNATMPKGMLLFRMTLNEEGDVKDVVALENTFNNLRLANCLMYIIKGTRFDQAGVTMETFVEYPFVFNDQGKLR